MINLNKVLVVGRLTRDPETRSVSGGKMVANFTVAINRLTKSGEQSEADFVDVQAWEKAAEFAESYLRKGSAVFVEGRLRQETWQDKESGQKRSKIGIVADRLSFAESKAEAESRGGNSSTNESREPAQRDEPKREEPQPKDDLPF